MPEITADLTDLSRCVSVHWSLPVQCVLPRTHAGIWHEAWHPHTSNRMRYRRAMSVFVTEELHDGAWHGLAIPAPGVICGEPHSHTPGVFCQMEHGEDGNRWNHVAVVNGCRYSWNTPLPRPVTTDQLGVDVRSLRAEVERLRAENQGHIEHAGSLLVQVKTAEDERGQFADRVDTLTAVAKGNKRHVTELMGDLSAAQSRIAALELSAKPEAAPLPGESCTCMPHRRLPCGHCAMDICEDCARCPCTCKCSEGGERL